MFFRNIRNLFCYFYPCGSVEDYEPIKYTEMFLDDRVFIDHYFPERNYIVSLQLAFMDALAEIDKLKHSINQSAAITLVQDATETRQSYFDALKRIAELEAETEKLQILNTFYVDRMNALGERVSAKDACRYSDQTPSGQFVSKTGQSKADNMARAAMFAECGYTEKEISQIMGLSAGTIKNYISTAKGHFQTDEDINGRYVIFDATCGMRKFYFEKFLEAAPDRMAG